MTEDNLYCVAERFPNRLTLMIEPQFDRQIGINFFSRLTKDTRLSLDGHYSPTLLELFPNHCYVFLTKNVIENFSNIAQFLPAFCAITVFGMVSTFEFAKLSMHLKPGQYLLHPLILDQNILEDAMNNSEIQDEPSASGGLNSLIEAFDGQVEMDNRMVQFVEVRKNLTDITGLFLVPNPIGLDNSLLMSVALFHMLSAERLRQILYSYIFENRPIYVMEMGVKRYNLLMQSLRQENTNNWQILGVLSRLLQQDIYVLTQSRVSHLAHAA